MIGINPPDRVSMLTDVVTLPLDPGDQNSANFRRRSSLIRSRNRSVIQTVNVVRREDVVAELKACGGTYGCR